MRIQAMCTTVADLDEGTDYIQIGGDYWLVKEKMVLGCDTELVLEHAEHPNLKTMLTLPSYMSIMIAQLFTPGI